MSNIKIPVANVNKVMTRNLVKQMASGGFLPVIALEAFVEGGRTFQAYKRGGYDEARERITEEFTGAVFWLGGVTGLNWLFEKMGQKILKLPKKMVDISSDAARNPMENFLKYERRTNKNADKITKELMSKFKFVKVISSVLLANAFIGFLVPKINQAITRNRHKKMQNEQNNQNKNNNTETNSNINNGIISINDFGTKGDGKNIAFGGLDLLKIANKFENDRNYKLLSVDVGTFSGRTISARNNDERVEILFRDISSIFFYMFNMNLISKLFNKIQQNGIGTRLDPVSAEFATLYMQQNMTSDKMKLNEFKEKFLGQERNLPKSIKAKFQGDSIKTMTLQDFITELKKVTKNEAEFNKLSELARGMSKLQPEIKGTAIITEGQAKAVFNGGLINNPEFTREFLKNSFGTKFMKKYRFVAQNDIDDVLKDLNQYVKSIIADARKANAKSITREMLKKASSKNLKFNAINWGTGFVISAAFLSTIIPKTQYLITKWRTGKNEFPGTAQFKDNQDKKAS